MTQFILQRYLHIKDKNLMATRLCLSRKQVLLIQPTANDAVDDMMLFNQVQTWFQNRRTKEKKMAAEAEQNEQIRQRWETLA